MLATPDMPGPYGAKVTCRTCADKDEKGFYSQMIFELLLALDEAAWEKFFFPHAD